MEPSLRTVLRESHVAIIAIAMLLAQGLMWLFQIAWFPASYAIGILIDAIQYPYAARYTFNGIVSIQSIFPPLWGTILCFAVAWIVSRFVFSAGPFKTLIAYRAKL